MSDRPLSTPKAGTEPEERRPVQADGRARVWPHLAFVLLLIPAVAAAWRATSGLGWPGDQDFYRDVAQAQVIADGGFGQDAFYRGERLHYPPLTPAVVALLSRSTAIGVPRLFAQAGLWLNLLGPLAFYALAFRLLGPTAALLGSLSFIYLRTGPPYFLGGYTPWLFASSFAQGLCFLALLLVLGTLDRPTLGRQLAAGVMIGLTFLAHLGPALLLAVVVSGLLLLELPLRAAIQRLLLLGFVAALVASPHLLSLVGHYHLSFRNVQPGQWTAGFDEYWGDLLQWASLLGAAGILALLATRPRARAARFLVLFTLAAGAWLFLTAKTRFMVAPHHFLIYARTALDLGFGWLAAEALARLPVRAAYRSALAVAVPALIVALVWPGYLRATALGHDRRQALRCGARTEELALYAWLRANTKPEDVVLADESLSFSTIGPAGRGVIAIPSEWANPFVDNERRLRQRARLSQALRTGDWPTFCSLGSVYRVSYVVQTSADAAWRLPDPHFRERYGARLRVYSWESCPSEEGTGVRHAP